MKLEESMLKVGIILLFGFAIGGILGYRFGYDVAIMRVKNPISSFEECAAAGYPIMESYPEQCATPDGGRFVRDISGN